MNYLADYQTFESTRQLNEAIRKHAYANNFSLTESARAAFDVIAKHSVKYCGAAHLKAATIASAIGKSIKTARRAVAQLVTLGMVEKVETVRKVKGGDGANIFRILPFTSNDHAQMTTRQSADKPRQATVEAPKTADEAINPLSYKKSIINNTYKTAAKTAPLYAQIIDLIDSTIGEAKTANKTLVSRVYGVLKAKKVTDNTTATLALKTALMAFKQGLVRKDIVSYFSGTIDRMLAPVEQPKATPVRTELLPSWFNAPESAEAPEVDTDDDFLAMKAAMEAELAARK